ncbi:MAG: hypothetical protein QME66_10395 [Candidatus Eisenbacteria bacterium]|nr:hypothetical protein [Candidatus Eisenbacteria bacterium]
MSINEDEIVSLAKALIAMYMEMQRTLRREQMEATDKAMLVSTLRTIP